MRVKEWGAGAACWSLHPQAGHACGYTWCMHACPAQQPLPLTAQGGQAVRAGHARHHACERHGGARGGGASEDWGRTAVCGQRVHHTSPPPPHTQTHPAPSHPPTHPTDHPPSPQCLTRQWRHATPRRRLHRHRRVARCSDGGAHLGSARHHLRVWGGVRGGVGLRGVELRGVGLRGVGVRGGGEGWGGEGWGGEGGQEQQHWGACNGWAGMPGRGAAGVGGVGGAPGAAALSAAPPPLPPPLRGTHAAQL